LKYQGITTPDGMIVQMFGPIPGARHDNHILERSGLVEFLREHFPQDIVFGDAAYPKYPFLLSPFDNVNLTPNEIAFNKRMSSVRESVEWGFKDVLKNFKFFEMKERQRILLMPISQMWKVATILTNVLNCLYKCQTSQFFGLAPPIIQEYLQ
jgi:nuclease HARBI1